MISPGARTPSHRLVSHLEKLKILKKVKMRFIFLLFYISNGQMPAQFRPGQMFEEKKETSKDWVLDPVVQGFIFFCLL